MTAEAVILGKDDPQVLRVRDFRRGPGAVNMVVGFISDVQLAGFVTFAV